MYSQQRHSLRHLSHGWQERCNAEQFLQLCASFKNGNQEVRHIITYYLDLRYKTLNSPWSRGAPYEQRCLHSYSLHFFSHVDHFIQRGSDQPRQTNNIWEGKKRAIFYGGASEDLDPLFNWPAFSWMAVCRIFSHGVITPRSMTLHINDMK